MEVTRTNFQEVLLELNDVLDKATFLAIDGEFTGLNSGPDASAFDTPARYYSKLRAGSMDFLLIQFGLSVFTFDVETQKYSQRSYNFYIFPRPLNRAAPDSRFMCQASSISFLASQGFDFNKLFQLGIPYLTTTDEDKLMKRLEERQKSRDDFEVVTISDDDRPQIEDICKRIDEFLNSDAEELTVDKCNAFMRRLVHQETRIRWPNKLRVDSKSDYTGPSLIIQRAGTKEEEEQKEVEKREREKLEIKDAVGLSTLFRKIADSEKLIVGHNMLLDLCHIVHQFFGPLPESYQEFKSLLHLLFPRLLDTKVICHSRQFKENVPSSNLNVLLERVSKSPFNIPTVEPVDGRSYSTLEEKYHEAGYDAYMTGLCFISLSNYLGSLQNPQVPIVLSDSQLLNPFLNKLLIVRLKDFPYINLVAKDPNPSRDHVFHITFPKEWKHSDISQLFSPFGGVYVSWLSDTSAYVGLHHRDKVSAVLKNLMNQTGTFRIQKYVEYQASLETPAAGTERKRKLSSQENSESKEESAPSTNGVKTRQDDQGWKLATGNDPKLSSVSVIPSSYPHERSRATSRTHGGNRKVIKSVSMEVEVAHENRLKSGLNMSTDFPNGQKKNFVPKYTILRRHTENNMSKTEKVKDVCKTSQTRFSNIGNINDVEYSSDRNLIISTDNSVRYTEYAKIPSTSQITENEEVEYSSTEGLIKSTDKNVRYAECAKIVSSSQVNENEEKVIYPRVRYPGTQRSSSYVDNCPFDREIKPRVYAMQDKMYETLGLPLDAERSYNRRNIFVIFLKIVIVFLLFYVICGRRY